MKNKATQVALAVTASLALYSGTAAAQFLDFTIDEGSVPGADPSILADIDKLNGGYSEILTINPDLSFDTAAYATITQTFADDGNTSVPNQMGCIFTQCYNLYALFESSGVFTGTEFTGTTGEFRLYIDPLQDTSFAFGADGTVPVSTVNTADDYQVAFATSMVALKGIVGDPGAYDFVWDDFTLTSGDQNAATAGNQNGELYFVDPDPFYMRITVDGDFDEFPVAPGNILVTGDVSAVFVPEPATLALLGLGLVGLGFGKRRKA